jgi:hypothetical protein
MEERRHYKVPSRGWRRTASLGGLDFMLFLVRRWRAYYNMLILHFKLAKTEARQAKKINSLLFSLLFLDNREISGKFGGQFFPVPACAKRVT